MRESHKMGFEEYQTKIKNQLKVEQKRDKEYKNSKNITAEYDNQLFR